MSLQVWLPLDGNLNNQGIASCSVTAGGGVSVSRNGKIGQCYNFDGTNSSIMTNPSITLGQTFTIACWIKINDWNVDWGSVFKLYKSESSSCYDYIGCCMNQATATSHQLGVHIYKDVSGTRTVVFDQYYLKLTVGIWYHLCFVITPTSIITYINGLQTNNMPITVTWPAVTNYRLGLGKTAISPNLHCNTNDFRIYNHALSVDEVQKLALGLCGHWELGTRCVTNNLLHNASKYTVHSPLTDTKTVVDGYKEHPQLYYDHLEPGKTYVLSCESDGLLTPNHGQSHPASDKAFSMWLYLGNNHNGVATGYGRAVNFTTANYNYTKVGNVHTWVYTVPATDDYHTCDIRTNIYSNGTDACTVKWWNIKLEEGSVYSPFEPTEEKLDRIIEYDISGYKRDMYLLNPNTYLSTLLVNNSPKRYLSSYNFAGTYSLQSDSSFYRVNGDELTVCCWFYQLAKGGYQDLITCRGRSPHGTAGANYNWMLYLHQTNNTIQLHGNAQYPSNVSPSLNTWHFVVARVNANQTYDLFLDNEKVVTALDYQYHAESIQPSLTIGCYGNGNEKFNGYITDARVYATALSDADIEKLYLMKTS